MKAEAIAVKYLRGWIIMSALILVISAAVHFSTFAGIDTTEAVPGVMFIHVLIFLPALAVIFCTQRATREWGVSQEKIFKVAPHWMRVLTTVLGMYALINFVLYFKLSEGYDPQKRDGKYYLTQHSRIMREITEVEFHRHQAYVVRGFSGHWLAFSAAALTLLTGVAKCREEGGQPDQFESIGSTVP